jgi:hypothetical protein
MDNYFDNSALLKHQLLTENNNTSQINYWIVGLAAGVIVGVIAYAVFIPKINYYKQALEQEQNKVKNKTAELEDIQQIPTHINSNDFNSC